MSSRPKGKNVSLPAGSRYLFQAAPTEDHPEVLAAQRLLLPEGAQNLELRRHDTVHLELPASYHELAEAARTGDVTKGHKLLKAGAHTHPMGDLSALPEGQETPFVITVQTPLHIAAHLGHLPFVELLIRHKADVNMFTPVVDQRSSTPLMEAAQEGHVAVIRALLGAGADTNLRNTMQNTALWIAACKGHASCVRELLRHGGYAAGEVSKSLAMAVQVNRLDVIKVMVELGAAEEQHVKCSLLNWAVQHAAAELVQLLLKHGANPNGAFPSGNGGLSTPLRSALHSKQYGIAKILLERGADVHQVDEDGLDLVCLEAKGGRVEGLELLIAHGADIGRRCGRISCGPLTLACSNGHLDAAKFLLHAGADVNDCVSGYDLLRPLLCAIKRNQPAAAHLLILNGADLDLIPVAQPGFC